MVIKWAVDAVKNPDDHKIASPLIYKSLKVMAKRSGVADFIIERAEAIKQKDDGLSNAIQFLKNYINLELGRVIDGFTFNFPELLETEQERSYTEQLLHRGLTTRIHAGSQDALRVQLFRMSGTEWNDPELQSFVKQRLEHTLRSRLNSFHAADKSHDPAEFLKQLSALTEQFEKRGKRFFLISSTLLGVMRDGAFDPRINEIDIAVFDDEVSQSELETIVASVFTETQTAKNGCYVRGFSTDDGPFVDVHRAFREQDRIVFFHDGGTIKWTFQEFELIAIEFQGTQFFVPENYELILQQNYGNWRSPTIFFDHLFDPTNKTYIKNADSILSLTDYMIGYVESGARHHAHQSALLLKTHFGIDFTGYFPTQFSELSVPAPFLNRPDYPPIVLALSFDQLDMPLANILDTARDFEREVVAVPIPGGSDEANQLASSLRGVDRVETSSWFQHLVSRKDDEGNELPSVIVTNSECLKSIPIELTETCQVLLLDENTLALTKDENGSFMLRSNG
ncbi:MAG: hypothetical protein AAGA08_19655 [Pseudomonadota bacterium]